MSSNSMTRRLSAETSLTLTKTVAAVDDICKAAAAAVVVVAATAKAVLGVKVVEIFVGAAGNTTAAGGCLEEEAVLVVADPTETLWSCRGPQGQPLSLATSRRHTTCSSCGRGHR